MIIRNVACKKATFATKASFGTSQPSIKCFVTLSTTKSSSSVHGVKNASGRGGERGPRSQSCPYTIVVDAKKQKREQDREFLISVLESSATKRDAKAYLQTFGPVVARKEAKTALPRDGVIPPVYERPRFAQSLDTGLDETPHVAVVKLRRPQDWDDAVFNGVAKTLAQLRYLGLLSVIVVDSDAGSIGQACSLKFRRSLERQMNRVSTAIGGYGEAGVKIADSTISKTLANDHVPALTSNGLLVGFDDAITAPLRAGQLVIIPPLAFNQNNTEEVVDANDAVFSLVRFLSGLQFAQVSLDGLAIAPSDNQPVRKAWVDRVIVIDPVGGIPSVWKAHGANVFINLEDEFEVLQHNFTRQSHAIKQPNSEASTAMANAGKDAKKHLENLKLVKNTLAILPSASSAIITSPSEAANLDSKMGSKQIELSSLAGHVGTRRKQNPLIHNLLTDRPVYSSSLPIGRIKSAKSELGITGPKMPTTTLAKKGLPVTLFPDPHVTLWVPPRPGAPRLRLTDTCIDLPRLIHLINDSFNRELDAEAYLHRVQDSLAGIIIAGEYEGGAILTWEQPQGLNPEQAYYSRRLVPYLDKFAVLKKSQGAGGVADIVFNAMVRDCFPDGVCWRSRKNNPVNKWYFERSRGTRKLPDSTWAMFWTTPDAHLEKGRLEDYEDVCRNVVPTWRDQKPHVH